MSKTVYEFMSILQTRDSSDSENRTDSINYPSVLEHVRASVALHHATELAAALDNEESAVNLKELISRYIAEFLVGIEFNLDYLTNKVYEDMAGMGVLTKYLQDPTVEEININGYRTIEIITTEGTSYLLNENAFPSPEVAIALTKRMVRMGGMLLDAQTPRVDSYIGSGTRISAMIPPLIPKETGVAVSIRKQIKSQITREQLVKAKSVTNDMLDFILICVCYGISECLVGSTSSGKTTLLAYVIKEYILNNDDYNNRVYIVEDSRELNLVEYDEKHNRPARVIYTVTKKPPNPVTMHDLIITALRFDPKLIVPAEIREGDACFAAMSAAQTGHNTLTSAHAESAVDAYDRFVGLCRMYNGNIPTEQLFEMCIKAWPIMIFQKKLKDNTRKVMEIFEATGYKNGEVQGQMIYQFEVDWTERDVCGNILKVHGEHRKVGTISDKLYKKLRNNGAAFEVLDRLFPEKTERKELVS
ncbi:MAG: CpaF family protein [Oscillospiraceae bacterium]|nr:CpaF family protein [Oscillospiraceae bacterium]